ncbi:MAG: hypothetical protein KAH54_10380 [Candidatus Sabulitectum sp.]|nr:hypothetical protein [Candidatus Sabulitectum sp.]
MLKLIAPYLAVGVFWSVFSNGWLAILAYHLQTILWARRPFPSMTLPGTKQIAIFALPFLAAGPLFYFLLPLVTCGNISIWLTDHHLSGLSLILMIPYFGLVHPYLEQVHWAELRQKTPIAHLLFAGYHIPVLYSLLTIPWLIVTFVLLTAISYSWQQMRRISGSLALPVISHALSDLGIIMAVFFYVNR